jgi:hypothetical protein
MDLFGEFGALNSGFCDQFISIWRICHEILLPSQVSLPSGRCEDVWVASSGTVCDLKVAAQEALGQPFLTLTADGCLLNPWEPLQAAGLEDGECIAAVAQQPKVAATKSAFAVWCVGGYQVLTWGDPDTGGDSNAVQNQLKNIQQVCATGSAFAAMLADGSVITWGDPEYGGDCSPVRGQLRNVRKLHATWWAFAAILADGSVVTWGEPGSGGDITAVQGQLQHVKYIHATDNAFAAILADGTVVTWGDPESGGESTGVQDQLRNVQRIYATDSAFAAILSDESVVTWGDRAYGGDCTRVRAKLQNVREIHATSEAFVAILADDEVVAWGSQHFIADELLARFKRLPKQLRNGEQVCASRYVLAATFGDTAVVSWGHASSSWKAMRFENQQNFQTVCSTGSSFAAILADGTVKAVADEFDFTYQAVRHRLCNVQQLHANWWAFAAILRDGNLVTWGNPWCGGDSTAVQGQLVYL